MGKDNPFEVLELMKVGTTENFVAKVGLQDSTDRYKLGPPTRPDFKHDNGHLDKFAKREPTPADRDMYAKWQINAAASAVACEKNSLLGLEWSIAKYFRDCGGHQPEANKAYRHFLYGDGKPRTIDYEKYVEEEGRAGVVAMSKNFIQHAESIGKNRVKFSLTSTQMYAIGGQKAKIKGPTTTNWKRTIGAHQVWISADVAVVARQGKITYKADLTFHVEDQYNFNYKEQDEHSGIKDAENGMLELSGLGKQYMTHARFFRTVEWSQGEWDAAIITGPNGPAPINADLK
jgi:hypothetical protein